MSILRSRVAVLDTETSGWPSNPCASVIDVGGVILDFDGSEVSSYSSLVRPLGWGPWADGATAVHGLRYADVADAPKPADVTRDLVRWLDAHSCQWVTSYNVAFDRPMLARMGAHGWTPDELQGFGWGPCIQRCAAEPMHVAGLLQPPGDHTSPIVIGSVAYRPPSLRSAAAFFGVAPVEPAHRALSDARTAAAVLVAMRKKVSREG